MNKSIFLMTAAEESHLLDLSSRIDGALHAEQGETPQDFAKRLMDKEAVTAALQAAGIDTAKEADFLKRKTATPSFTVTMLIDNTAPADSRERLFLYTSKAPTTQAAIPQGAAIIDKYKSIATLKRTAQGKVIAEIREALISCKGISLPADSSYLPFALWDAFITTSAIIGNVINSALINTRPILSVGGKRINELLFPLDKFNATVWNMPISELNMLETDDKGHVKIKAEKAGSKKEINILYSIDFDAVDDDVKITKQLDAFDKRVYIAVAALFNAGNQVITMKQIYDAMGHKDAIGFERRTNPGASDVKKINDSLSKMRSALIYLNNEEEAKAYKYDLFIYDSTLLPFERLTAMVNGQLTPVIHPFREPPLVTFARERRQITPIKRKLLNTPLNKTNENISIEDYLLIRIAHAKTGTLSRKILFSTIYEEARIAEKKQRQRAPKKIFTLLDYYADCEHIVGYAKEPDGVILFLTEQQKEEYKKKNCRKVVQKL